MKKAMKILGVLLATVTASTTMLFAGCNGNQDSEEYNGPIDLNIDKNVSATISVGIQQSVSERDTMNAFVTEFNKVYPNVKVDIVELEGNYTSALMAKVRTNTVPDVVWVRDEDVSYFAANNFLLNLDSFIAADTEFKAEDYYESMLNLGKMNLSGSQYMLPRDYNKIIVYYNKDLFTNAGISSDSEFYPKDDWTYEEFLSTCLQLKSNLPNGVYPVDAMLTWAPIYNTFIRSFGGQIMDENGKPAFDSEEAIKGLDAMNTLYSKGYTINPSHKTEDLFLSGKSVMWFSTRPSITAIEAQNLNYDAVTFPFVGEHGYIGTGASGYAVASSSKNKTLAYIFTRTMLSKESQEAFSKTGNAVPVRLDLAEKGKWLESPNDILFFNHYAFVKHPERDSLTDYLVNVNADYTADINSKIIDLLDRYMGWSDPNTTKDRAAEIADVKADMNRILTSD